MSITYREAKAKSECGLEGCRHSKSVSMMLLMLTDGGLYCNSARAPMNNITKVFLEYSSSIASSRMALQVVSMVRALYLVSTMSLRCSLLTDLEDLTSSRSVKLGL